MRWLNLSYLFFIVFLYLAVLYAANENKIREELTSVAQAVASDWPKGERERRIRVVNNLPLNPDVPRPKKIGSDEKFADCSSALVKDVKSGAILYAKNASASRSIASITKLMTALVFLEHNPGWEQVYEIGARDRREGGRINLFPGEKMKVRDLFYASLVASDNVATMALANATGLSEKDFVAAMNAKAKYLGLSSTHFVEPIGLDDNNISTAEEIAKLVQTALIKDEIVDATAQGEYLFKTLSGREKKFVATDRLVSDFEREDIKLIGGKTGYNNAAGYCLASSFVNQDGNQIITVVLGSSDKESRFTETAKLAEWTYDNFQW